MKTIVVGVLLAVFLAALDQTIVATALPTIAAEFHGGGHLSWVVSAYLLTATASTPIYGKLGDLYGRRLLLTIAILVFMAASVWCAFATSMTELVAARALHGLGGGGLMTLSQATMGEVVAPRERGKYQAYFAGVFACSSVGGPVLGGAFVDFLSWRWIFWMNLPVGLAALVLCRYALRRLPVRRHKARIDYLGALLLTGGVAALLLLLAWGGNTFAWTSPVILGLGALAIALLVVFAGWEMRAPDPLLPPQLFANRVFRAASIVIFFSTMAMLGSVSFMPLYLQLAAGVSASNAGLLIIPLTFGIVVGSTISGRVMMLTGRYKWLPIVGMVIGTACFGVFAFTTTAHSALLHGAVMGGIGTGIGMCFPVVTVSVQNAVPVRMLGTATSANGLARQLGGAVGVAVVGALLADAVASITTTLAEVSAAAARPGMTLTDLSGPTRERIFQSVESAFEIMFWACAAMTVLALLGALIQKEIPLRRHVEPVAPASE
ncbi:MAG: MFS transporter [Rhodospirillaceae bacterium]|nr:MFS transporter [Rhodospirillaceae bacterium]